MYNLKLSISNLAWNQSEESDVINLFKEHELGGVDIAPTKIWENPLGVSDFTLKNYKNFWNQNGVKIISLQSLLFGHPELTIFETKERRNDTVNYLSKIFTVAKQLGASRVVFGSPKNRRIDKLSTDLVNSISLDFFHKLDKILVKYDLMLCVEPNPKEYDCDFITNHFDAVKLVKELKSNNIKINIDTSTIIYNKEDISSFLGKFSKYVGYIHLSVPELTIFGGDKYILQTNKIMNILNNKQYDDWISLEMLSSTSDGNVDNIKSALKYIESTYDK